MDNRNILFIHYWKKTVSNEELDSILYQLRIYSRKYWLIIFEEKLLRNEQEIYIK